jgi:hypothetical protein
MAYILFSRGVSAFPKAGFPLANFFPRSEIFFCLYPISSRWFQLREQWQMKNSLRAKKFFHLRFFSREAKFSFVFIQLVPDGSSWETNDKWKIRFARKNSQVENRLNVRSGEVGTLIKTLHMSTTCSCRCVLETCTPACDWVYAFKCISDAITSNFILMLLVLS